MMDVRLEEASREQKPVLERLAQLYMYDFSEFAGGDVSEAGLFEYMARLGDYWTERERGPFLVRVDGKIAGFVLVASHSALRQAGKVNWVAEFFVMRKYRRRGVGRAVAIQVFDRFPGKWEVAEMRENVAAQAFWRKVIGEYTGGDFAETVLDDESWHGPVQSFDNSSKAPARWSGSASGSVLE